jgi:hypothetical protein
VDAGTESGEQYRRELRDLLVAVLDFRCIPASPPPTQNPSLRSDLCRAAECLSDLHLRSLAPAELEAHAVWLEVADDILACLEHGRWHQLRPTEWAVRVKFAWWFKLSWLGRAWYRLRRREGSRLLAGLEDTHARTNR